MIGIQPLRFLLGKKVEQDGFRVERAEGQCLEAVSFSGFSYAKHFIFQSDSEFVFNIHTRLVGCYHAGQECDIASARAYRVGPLVDGGNVTHAVTGSVVIIKSYRLQRFSCYTVEFHSGGSRRKCGGSEGDMRLQDISIILVLIIVFEAVVLFYLYRQR